MKIDNGIEKQKPKRASKASDSGWNYSGIRRVYISHSRHCWTWFPRRRGNKFPRILSHYPRGMQIYFEFRKPCKASSPASIRGPYYKGTSYNFFSGRHQQVFEVGEDDDIVKVDIWTDKTSKKHRGRTTAIRFYTRSGIISPIYGISNREPPSNVFQGKHEDSRLARFISCADLSLYQFAFGFRRNPKSTVKDSKLGNGSIDAAIQDEAAQFRKHFLRCVSSDAEYLKRSQDKAKQRISENGSNVQAERKFNVYQKVMRFFRLKCKTLKATNTEKGSEKVEDTTEATSAADSCDSSDRSSFVSEYLPTATLRVWFPDAFTGMPGKTVYKGSWIP